MIKYVGRAPVRRAKFRRCIGLITVHVVGFRIIATAVGFQWSMLSERPSCRQSRAWESFNSATYGANFRRIAKCCDFGHAEHGWAGVALT